MTDPTDDSEAEFRWFDDVPDITVEPTVGSSARRASRRSDVDAKQRRGRRQLTRRRGTAIAVGAVVLAAGLAVALPALVSNEDSGPDEAAADPGAAGPREADLEIDGPADGDTDPNLRQPLFITEAQRQAVGTPHLIVSDADGSFVGARTPAFSAPRRATFTRSENGEEWVFESVLVLADYDYVERFERIGDRYVIWVDNSIRSDTADEIRLGVSDDLVKWTLIELATGDRAPQAFVYTSDARDVAVRGDDVLLQVETAVDLDWDRLGAEREEFCSTVSSEDDAQCAGFERLLELPLTANQAFGIEQSMQLYLSRGGEQPVPVLAPFGSETPFRLVTVGDQFGLIDTEAQSVALSDDGINWTIVNSVLPDRFAATRSETTRNFAGSNAGVVGVGDVSFGPVIFFWPAGGGWFTRNLAYTVGAELATGAIDVSIGAGAAGWGMFVSEKPGRGLDQRSWLLHSPDGVGWTVLSPDDALPAEASVSVGDDELLLLSRTDPRITRVHLPD